LDVLEFSWRKIHESKNECWWKSHARKSDQISKASGERWGETCGSALARDTIEPGWSCQWRDCIDFERSSFQCVVVVNSGYLQPFLYTLCRVIYARLYNVGFKVRAMSMKAQRSCMRSETGNDWNHRAFASGVSSWRSCDPLSSIPHSLAEEAIH